jgi:hypothetical protein
MNAAAHSSVCAGDRRPGRREMEVLYLYQALCVYAPAEQNLGQTVTQFGHYLPRGSLTFAARWWRRSTHTYTNSNASAAVKSHYAPLQLNLLCYNCRMLLRPKIKILRDGSFFCTEVTSRFFFYAFYIYCSLGECSAGIEKIKKQCAAVNARVFYLHKCARAALRGHAAARSLGIFDY